MSCAVQLVLSRCESSKETVQGLPCVSRPAIFWIVIWNILGLVYRLSEEIHDPGIDASPGYKRPPPAASRQAREEAKAYKETRDSGSIYNFRSHHSSINHSIKHSADQSTTTSILPPCKIPNSYNSSTALPLFTN
jgi:hypothetical protein